MNYNEDRDGNLILEDGTVISAEERQRAEVYSRIVGYLRPVEQWNDGKQAEFADRKTYSTKPVRIKNVSYSKGEQHG